MEVRFSKYHGAGNDFIFIDNRDARYKLNSGQREKMCQRHFGIGADGLLEIRSSDVADFQLMYFNSDGNEGTLCGNGSRCAIAFAIKIGIRKRDPSLNETEMVNCERRFKSLTHPDNETNKIGGNFQPDVRKNKTEDNSNVGTVLDKMVMFLGDYDSKYFIFEAFDGIHNGGVSEETTTYSGNHSNMFFVDIKDVKVDQVTVYDNGDIFIHNGSPHHVAFLSCYIETFEVVKHGRELRYELYGNEGSNINFVSRHGRALSYTKNLPRKVEEETKVETSHCEHLEKENFQQISGQDEQENSSDESSDDNLDNNVLFVRTYERGVEDETLACGTGCVAVALADYLKKITTVDVHNVDKNDLNVKGDITSIDEGGITTTSNDGNKSDLNGVTIVSKCTVQNGDPPETTDNTIDESKKEIRQERRIMKTQGGCLIVTFVVNKIEGLLRDSEILFSDIKLSGPVEHVFDGVCTI